MNSMNKPEIRTVETASSRSGQPVNRPQPGDIRWLVTILGRRRGESATVRAVIIVSARSRYIVDILAIAAAYAEGFEPDPSVTRIETIERAPDAISEPDA